MLACSSFPAVFASRRKSFERAIVGRDAGWEHLEGDPAVHRSLPRLVDHSHPAATHLPPKGVVAEDAERRGLGRFAFPDVLEGLEFAQHSRCDVRIAVDDFGRIDRFAAVHAIDVLSQDVIEKPAFVAGTGIVRQAGRRVLGRSFVPVAHRESPLVSRSSSSAVSARISSSASSESSRSHRFWRKRQVFRKCQARGLVAELFAELFERTPE